MEGWGSWYWGTLNQKEGVRLSASLGAPKARYKSRKPRTACQVCHIRGFFQGVEDLGTPEPETPASEHYRVDGGGSPAS